MSIYEPRLNEAEQARIEAVVAKAKAKEKPGKPFDPTLKSRSRVKKCSDCGVVFEQTHGNQKKCPTCRKTGKALPVRSGDGVSTVSESVKEREVSMVVMGVMDVVEVNGYRIEYDVPEPFPYGAVRHNEWVPWLKSLLASGHENGVITTPGGQEAKKLREKILAQAKRHGLEVQACRRGEKVFVRRAEDKKSAQPLAEG